MHFLKGFLPVIEFSLTFLNVLLYAVYIRVYYLDLDFLVLELTVSIFYQKKLNFFYLLETFHDL